MMWSMVTNRLLVKLTAKLNILKDQNKILWRWEPCHQTTSRLIHSSPVTDKCYSCWVNGWLKTSSSNWHSHGSRKAISLHRTLLSHLHTGVPLTSSRISQSHVWSCHHFFSCHSAVCLYHQCLVFQLPSSTLKGSSTVNHWASPPC